MISFSSLYSFICISKTFRFFSLQNDEFSDVRLFCCWNSFFYLKFMPWGMFLIELFLDYGLKTRLKRLDSIELYEFWFERIDCLYLFSISNSCFVNIINCQSFFISDTTNYENNYIQASKCYVVLYYFCLKIRFGHILIFYLSL